MADASSTPFVAALCLLAVLMSFVLVRRLKRRERATLRASVVAFMWGLAGAELALLPAFVAALTTDGVLGLRHSDTDFWIVTTVYVVITIYVIARLFPWREVQALTSEPDAKLRDIMTALMAKNRAPVKRRDERDLL